MTGVPIEEATANDFMQVRAALVKRLGGANEALVWTRINYRAEGAQHAHRTPDGRLWWAAPRGVIAEETGLTSDQVRRALEKLIAGGFLMAESHHGNDRTMSYSPVVHRADTPDGIPSGSDAPSIGRTRPVHRAHTPNAPTTETSKTVETTPTSPLVTLALVPPLTPDPLAEFGQAFEAVWKTWPVKKNKPKSQTAYRAALKRSRMSHEQMAVIVNGHLARWATWTEFDRRFIPYFSSWLNSDAWNDDLPEDRSVGHNGNEHLDYIRRLREQEQQEGPGPKEIEQ